MKTKYYNIAKGIGSILEIMPPPEPFTPIRPSSPDEIVRRSIERIGRELDLAIKRVSADGTRK